MPTSEFEKKIHRWASLICCFGSYRCLVRVGSICNLLELDLQMPGRGWKHLQFAGIGAADAWPGLEASAICWIWICRCLSWVRKHLQLAGIGFVDAWSGSEVSALCWIWICRCLSWGWKYLQFAGIGFADAWSGSEASAICWYWTCRYI